MMLLQIPLAEASQKYVTINIHRGLFKYTRLPFGVSAPPAIFQHTILQGIPGVAVYIDDILATGRRREDHLSTLDVVLRQLEATGLWLKRCKCVLCDINTRLAKFLFQYRLTTHSMTGVAL